MYERLTTPEQHALASYMEDLSQECWAAGWLHGTEFVLWEFISMDGASADSRRAWGNGEITAGHAADLCDLALACDGWIYWDDWTDELRWASLELWELMYAAWKNIPKKAHQA